MEGQRVSHYDVLERLGGGGMGVVYRALDTRLQRHVALKFLPPELTRDDEARARFVQEAQAASALDHPNICTIYEIDTTSDGQMFIAMALYRGETLKRRIERGPLPVADAIDVAGQIARGLAKAHAAGIVHRDIKPANVIITEDGFAKVLDFGIAKLLGVTGPTRTGSTLGTISYMSPEQVNGEEVDPRSDVWALGAVLYEMLTGTRAFGGDNEWAILGAIADREPTAPRALRADVPAAVEAVVMRALQKSRERRTGSAEAMRKELEATMPSARSSTGAISAVARRVPSRGLVAAGVALLVLVVGGAALASVLGGRDRTWVREVAVPEVERLLLAGQYDSAWVVAREAEAIAPDEEAIAQLWPQFTASLASIRTDPPGATVRRRPYGAEGRVSWEVEAITPTDPSRLLLSGGETWEIELAGYEPLLLASYGIEEVIAGSPYPVFVLDRPGALPEGMVRVPGWTPVIDDEPARQGDFLIDRFEVTNRQYKAFVDAGGYRDPRYWEHAFVLEGRTLSREEALGHFTDQTGRAGPSTWVAGTYPDGEDDHPVAGVSWYEAAAYAKYVGKDLPSFRHWRRAYGTVYSMEALIPRSNFGGNRTAPVGAYEGIGPFGTFDMAGNVREWAVNAIGDDHPLLGGGWNDPDYVGVGSLIALYPQPAFDRSATNGIRLVTYLEHGPDLERALAPVQPTPVPDFREVVPRYSDEEFEIFRRMYAYDASPLEAVVEESVPSRRWTRERISFNAAYGGERVLLYLYLPAGSSLPLQPVLFWPGGATETFTSIEQNPTFQVDFLVQSGRAVALPVLKGTLERNDRFSAPAQSTATRDRYIEQVQDVMRTLDYLESRPDIDTDRLAYYGWSWGGSRAPVPLALEPRFKAAVLDVAGVPRTRTLPEVDPIAYLPRVTLPVLMVNGRLDAVFPLETHARPFFDLLGTAPDRKRFVVSEAGHLVPKPQLIRETLDWLDRYVGPVAGR